MKREHAKCGNCRYSHYCADSALHQCKRCSPQVVVIDGKISSSWPIVDGNDYCWKWIPDKLPMDPDIYVRRRIE